MKQAGGPWWYLTGPPCAPTEKSPLVPAGYSVSLCLPLTTRLCSVALGLPLFFLAGLLRLVPARVAGVVVYQHSIHTQSGEVG